MTTMGLSISLGRSMCVCWGCSLAGPVVRAFICTGMHMSVCFCLCGWDLYFYLCCIFMAYLMRNIYGGILVDTNVRAEG